MKKETGIGKWFRRLEAYGYDLDDGKNRKQKNDKREKDPEGKKSDRRR